MTDIDTTNKFLVSSNAGSLKIFRTPDFSARLTAMTSDDALVLAAWLVALAEPDATHSFADVLAAVQNS